MQAYRPCRRSLCKPRPCKPSLWKPRPSRPSICKPRAFTVVVCTKTSLFFKNLFILKMFLLQQNIWKGFSFGNNSTKKWFLRCGSKLWWLKQGEVQKNVFLFLSLFQLFRAEIDWSNRKPSDCPSPPPSPQETLVQTSAIVLSCLFSCWSNKKDPVFVPVDSQHPFCLGPIGGTIR